MVLGFILFNTLTVTILNYKRINSMKTSSEYLREYNEAQDKVKRLENEISERLLQLSIMRPNVILTKHNGIDIYARGITKFYIDSLPVVIRVRYIRTIEEAIANEASYIQGRLF